MTTEPTGHLPDVQRVYVKDGALVPLEEQYLDTTEWGLVTYADHVAALAAAYEKGRHHGWALNAECCGSCPGECEQRIALNEIKREGTE